MAVSIARPPVKERLRGKDMVFIYRGEDTDFAGAEPILIKIDTELDLTGYTAKLMFGSVVKSYGPDDVGAKVLPLVFSAAESSGFFPGRGYATIHVYDTEGRTAILKKFVIDVRFRDQNRITAADVGEAVSVVDNIRELAERLQDLTSEDDLATIKATLNDILAAARKRVEFAPVTIGDHILVGTEKALCFVQSVGNLEAVAMTANSITKEDNIADIKDAINSRIKVLKK